MTENHVFCLYAYNSGNAFKREKVRQVYKENTCNAPFFFFLIRTNYVYSKHSDRPYTPGRMEFRKTPTQSYCEEISEQFQLKLLKSRTENS